MQARPLIVSSPTIRGSMAPFAACSSSTKSESTGHCGVAVAGTGPARKSDKRTSIASGHACGGSGRTRTVLPSCTLTALPISTVRVCAPSNAVIRSTFSVRESLLLRTIEVFEIKQVPLKDRARHDLLVHARRRDELAATEPGWHGLRAHHPRSRFPSVSIVFSGRSFRGWRTAFRPREGRRSISRSTGPTPTRSCPERHAGRPPQSQGDQRTANTMRPEACRQIDEQTRIA